MLKFILLSLLLSTDCFNSALAAKEVWKVASLEWQPYSGQKLKFQGESIQKLRKLLAKKNIELQVDFYPWKRAMNFAKGKDYIGYFPAWPEEVIAGFVPTLGIDTSNIALLTYKNKFVKLDTLENIFKKNTIGIVKTYAYPKVINDLIIKYPANVFGALNESSLLKMLVKNRFSVIITDPRVVKYLAKKKEIAGITVLKMLMKKELVLSMRDDSENVKRIEIINKLLKSK